MFRAKLFLASIPLPGAPQTFKQLLGGKKHTLNSILILPDPRIIKNVLNIWTFENSISIFPCFYGFQSLMFSWHVLLSVGWLYIYIYIYLYIYIYYLFIYLFIYSFIYIFIWFCTNNFLLKIYICIYMYIYIYVYLYICIHIYMYI